MPPGGEMRVRLDDRLGVAAVTYLLFGVKLGPALALSVILVFGVWIGLAMAAQSQSPSRLALSASTSLATPSVSAHEGSDLAGKANPCWRRELVAKQRPTR